MLAKLVPVSPVSQKCIWKQTCLCSTAITTFVITKNKTSITIKHKIQTFDILKIFTETKTTIPFPSAFLLPSRLRAQGSLGLVGISWGFLHLKDGWATTQLAGWFIYTPFGLVNKWKKQTTVKIENKTVAPANNVQLIFWKYLQKDNNTPGVNQIHLVYCLCISLVECTWTKKSYEHPYLKLPFFNKASQNTKLHSLRGTELKMKHIKILKSNHIILCISYDVVAVVSRLSIPGRAPEIHLVMTSVLESRVTGKLASQTHIPYHPCVVYI